jgi:hypothetical protein
MAGQMMQAAVSSPTDEVVGLSIWGADGTVLKRYVDDTPEWMGELPSTQDYFVSVVSIQETDYTLTITISPLAGEPTRIAFEPGETEAEIGGDLEPGEMDRYVLRALAGQHLIVWAVSPGRDVFLGLRGADGPSLVPLAVETDFAVAVGLPSSQDYIVSALATGGGTPYVLKVAVPRTEDLPTRIRFAEGSTSATLTGSLAEGGDYARTVLRALAGQTMTVEVTPAADVGIWVAGEDGSFWHAPFDQGALTVALPLTQDYFVTLFSPPGSDPVDFTLEVTIP